jgi:prepilin-type N-terminal cleavage/methylation domain-containing protein
MGSDKGFTLIELLIGIGIIGTIGYVAIPNLDCITKTAEDTEAKTELSAVVAAEKIHFAKFDTYTGCLKQAGYRPRPDRTFTIGFSNKTISSYQPRCGRPTDPKWRDSGGWGMYRLYPTQNCNTWGNRAANVCNTADADINSPDSASDINFAANKASGNSIPVSFTNMNVLDIPCQKSLTSDSVGSTWSACWGQVNNYSFAATAFRGRTFDGKKHLSGFMAFQNGMIEAYEAAKAGNY